MLLTARSHLLALIAAEADPCLGLEIFLHHRSIRSQIYLHHNLWVLRLFYCFWSSLVRSKIPTTFSLQLAWWHSYIICLTFSPENVYFLNNNNIHFDLICWEWQLCIQCCLNGLKFFDASHESLGETISQKVKLVGLERIPQVLTLGRWCGSSSLHHLDFQNPEVLFFSFVIQINIRWYVTTYHCDTNEKCL